MMEEGKKVLVWAEKEHEKNTWPRADYQEMLQLVIFCLGGCVKNFSLRIPGPDPESPKGSEFRSQAPN